MTILEIAYSIVLCALFVQFYLVIVRRKKKSSGNQKYRGTQLPHNLNHHQYIEWFWFSLIIFVHLIFIYLLMFSLLLLCRCNGKQLCSFVVNNNYFGDHCPKTSKYLDAEYECISNSGKIFLFFNELWRCLLGTFIGLRLVLLMKLLLLFALNGKFF